MRPFHPPLVAVHMPLALYASNMSLVPLREIWLPCLVAVLASAALWGAAWLFVRDAARSSLFATAAVLSLSWFGDLEAALSPLSRSFGRPAAVAATWTVWAALGIFLCALSLRKWRQSARVAAFLNVAAVLLVAVTLVSIGVFHWRVQDARPQTERSQVVRPLSARPDVFFVLLDGFGREDVLVERYGMAGGLESELESLGFVVARGARANYVQTELSLASSLNMAHIRDLVTPVGDANAERALLDRLIDQSEVAATFRSLGYKFVAVTTGFPALNFPSADLQIGSEMGTSLYVDALLRKTPFRPSRWRLQSQFDSRRALLHGAFDHLGRLAPRTDAPRFVFVHVFAPHPPFVFGANGESVNPPGHYTIEDGSHFVANVASADAYRAGYADQAAYLSKLLVRSLRTVIEKQPGCVVIVQSDHGPKSALDHESLVATDVNECFPILSAFYAPESVRGKLSDEGTPVNDFRAVFSGLFSMEYEPLADASFYSTWSRPLEFTDVTRQIEPRPPAPLNRVSPQQ